MIRILLIITLISTLYSCDTGHSLKSGSGLHYIKDLKFSLSNYKSIDWKVGRKRDKVVSQGFLFEIQIPKVKDKDTKLLYAKYGIDSWLFTIKKITPKIEQELGFIQYNFSNISSNTKKFSAKVLYHAASVSVDFRRFHCPAFGHRLKLGKHAFIDNSFKQKNLFTTDRAKTRKTVSKTSFSILSYSAGTSLRAKYIVELAFYNSKTGRIYGEPVTGENLIEVQREEIVSLPSCLGIKEEITPLPESRPPSLRDLEIKK